MGRVVAPAKGKNEYAQWVRHEQAWTPNRSRTAHTPRRKQGDNKPDRYRYRKHWRVPFFLRFVLIGGSL